MRLLILFLIFSALVACGTLAPYAEKKQAVLRLETARQVEAETYAPQPFKEAKAMIENGDKLTVTNQKSPSNKKAREAFLRASSLADVAYADAVPSYTKRFIDKAEEALNQARDEKVHVALKEEFGRAEVRWKEAKGNHEGKSYMKAREQAQDALRMVEELRGKTRFLKERAFSLVDQTSKDMKGAKEEKVHVALKDQYEQMEGEWTGIRSQVEAGSYRESIVEAEQLKEHIRDAVALTRKKRRLAKEAYEEADGLLKEVKHSASEEEIKKK